MQEDDFEDLVDLQTALFITSGLRIELLELKVATNVLDKSCRVSQDLGAIDDNKRVHLCRVVECDLLLASFAENVAHRLNIVGLFSRVKNVAHCAHLGPNRAPIDLYWSC